MAPSVLIVDDEKILRDTLIQYIKWEELGIENVYDAEDGVEALKIAEKLRPEIIISDIKMPKKNGMELAEEIREFIPNCKFVFLSGYPDKEYLKGAIKLKVANFIEKPIDLAEISAVVGDLAEECRKEGFVTNQQMLFYRGRHEHNQPLNDKIYIVDKTLLHEFEKSLKAGERSTTERKLCNIITDIRKCEATNPEYVRNVFYQIVFLIVNTAESRNITEVCSQSEHLLYIVAKADMLDEIAEEINAVIALYFDEIQSEDIDPMTRLNTYLQTHYTEESITINSIAQVLNFTPTYLCLVYKKNTGKTINHQLTILRIEKAKELLLCSNAKLYEVAGQVGYSDGKYFTRVFTKIIGISPKEYRERHCNEKRQD